MMQDILTIMWKEWKELFLRRGSVRSGLFNIVIIVGLLGIFMPLQTGKEWLSSGTGLLIWSWIPVFLTTNIIADAFAGERERHTLETLLASRLSDRSILIGKIMAAVSYALTIAVASMLIGAVTINISNPIDGIQFYTGWVFPLAIFLVFLTAFLMSCIGVIVSLNAPTTRHAYQRLSIIVMAVWLVPIIALQVIPDEVIVRFAQSAERINTAAIIPAGIGLLILADALLIMFAMKKFKRNQLILE